VRTGCGKSQTSRAICRSCGRPASAWSRAPPDALRRPRRSSACSASPTIADLEKHDCTIEEMEEYEPHVAAGGVIYAGVDYEAILREAEKEADVILWDGGNNDTPFYKSDLHIVVADPHRPGHEKEYYPGETNVRLADVVVINKVVEAEFEDIQTVRDNIARDQPRARSSSTPPAR
jgi:predicted GTPase